MSDANIELGKVAAPTNLTADGGGITLKGASDKTITWTNSTDAWHFNQGINVTSGNVGIGTGAPTSAVGFDRFLTVVGTNPALGLKASGGSHWEVASLANGNLRFVIVASSVGLGLVRMSEMD